MLNELDACRRSDCCPQMVRFYGAMFREGDVWICMEVMDTSLDKFYRHAYKIGKHIPEPFIGKMALSVIEGLNFMKEQLNLIHRDVKPSNILLNRHGQVKICDFGISGHLTNSMAKVRKIDKNETSIKKMKCNFICRMMSCQSELSFNFIMTGKKNFKIYIVFRFTDCTSRMQTLHATREN